MPVKGTYLAITGAGGLLLWSGLNGKSWSNALRDLLSGKDPHASTTAYAITPGSPVSSQSGAAGGMVAGDLAAALQSYVGVAPYRWGGATPSGWDCSGAVNKEASQLGYPIPGYAPHTFTGQTHGPPTVVWMVWAPTHMSKISRANVQRDDICLWQTHMGVAIDNVEYVSAYSSKVGTAVRNINTGGPTLEIPTFWRYRSNVGVL